MFQIRMQYFGFETNVVEWDDWSGGSSPPEIILWELGLVNEHSLAKIVAVLKELREKLPHAKIFLHTALPRIDEIRTLHESGADQVLSPRQLQS